MEEWKDIPGFEGQYQASSEGRIRSLRVLKPVVVGGTGYHAVTLTGKNRCAVHKLVSLAFHGPMPKGKTEVNHIDAVRTNNKPSNLEYVTRSENVRHAFKVGSLKHSLTTEQMDFVAQCFFSDLRSQTWIARQLLPQFHTVQQLRQMRKKVRSVIEIWRCEHRPKAMRNPYEHKLDANKARQIRSLYATGATTQAAIAKMFDVHPAHVSRVISGQLWPESTAGSVAGKE